MSRIMGVIEAIPALYKRPKDGMAYNPQIDGLRCLAILSVLVWHGGLRIVRHGELLDPGGGRLEGLYAVLPHGEIGVVLFFMISGLIIARPFLGDPSRPVAPGKFYYRRFHRLYPPYLIALGLCSIPVFLDVLHHNHTWRITPTESFLASMAYVHGVVWNAPSMFIPPLWSLEVEVQFYLLFPMLIVIYRKMGASRIASTLAVLALYVVTLGYIHGLYGFDGRFRFGLVTHLPYFIMGIIVADLAERHGAAARRRAGECDLLLCAGLVLFLLAGLALTRVNAEARPPVLYSALQALSMLSCLCVMVGAMYGRRGGALFGNAWICLTGTMCYSIYLVHVPLMEAIETVVLHRLPATSPVLLGMTDAAVLLPSVWLAGLGFYIFVERPFMNRQARPVPSASLVTEAALAAGTALTDGAQAVVGSATQPSSAPGS
ncbi:acyltransferase [Nguyenibacter sp. L1]|uniref:acyltransferase family protein n=1 Tax=Nguyenibacter sp. L1 TaxID=3049350 RepID=UPI002B4A8F71|nr:acyltransferase [Nguyenibacter sp. L1]WRH88688.1 acyltransferase [Nguyenibacter sp. L1]